MTQNPTRKTPDNPADNIAEYWSGAITRKEAQQAFDEMSESIKVISAQMSAFTMSMAYLFWKLQVPQPEFETFVKARVAQMDAAAGAPPPPSDVVTN